MFAAEIASVATAVQARDGPACSAVSGHLNCAQAGSGAVADDLGQSERSKPGSQHLFTSVHSWSADGGVRRRKFGRCFSIRRTAVRRIVDKRTLFPLNHRASSPENNEEKSASGRANALHAPLGCGGKDSRARCCVRERTD